MKSMTVKDKAEFLEAKAALEQIYLSGQHPELDLIFHEKLLSEINRFFDQMIRANGLSKTFFRFVFLPTTQQDNHDRES